MTPPPPTLIIPETLEVYEEPTPPKTSTLPAIEPTGLPATPTAGTDFSSPPPATLVVEGASQVSGIGTFCWTSDAMAGICADYMGVPTPAEPLQVNSPLSATLELEVEGAPSTLHLDVFRVSAEMDQLPENPDSASWPFPRESELRRDLPLGPSAQFEFSLDPGLYVLSVFAAWDDLGDVNYGFLVEVH